LAKETSSVTMSRAGTTLFGERLRRYRLAAGLSQEALAVRAGLSVDAIRALERGRRSAPRPETLAMLAEALALTPLEREELVIAADDRAAPEPESTPAPPADAGPVFPAPPSVLIGREHE
jgi:transcriptional regulator with XRE-family HTH domain